MNEFAWIVTGLSLTGVVLNIRKQRAGFAVWILTNSYWAVYDYQMGARAQSALFIVYLLLALWGLWEWSNNENSQKQSGRNGHENLH